MPRQTTRISPALSLVLIILALAAAWELIKLIFNLDQRAAKATLARLQTNALRSAAAK